MRYGWGLGLVTAAMLAGPATADVTREHCIALLADAEKDREGLMDYVNDLISRFNQVAEMDSKVPEEKELQESTFSFADQIDAHVARYAAAIGDLCRDKI